MRENRKREQEKKLFKLLFHVSKSQLFNAFWMLWKNFRSLILISNIVFRAVAKGGGLGGISPPVFGKSVNPISNRGAHYPHPALLAPPDFQTLRRHWYCFNIAKIFNINHKTFSMPDEVKEEQNWGTLSTWCYVTVKVGSIYLRKINTVKLGVLTCITN